MDVDEPDSSGDHTSPTAAPLAVRDRGGGGVGVDIGYGVGDRNTMSAEAVKAAVEAAMLAENMSLAEASGDKGVRLGEAGWRDRYYANKLGPEVRKKLTVCSE